jgi:hypothetical protein
MERKTNRRNDNEWPIAKPPYPLPALFCPSKRSESPTRRRVSDLERARFYRKRTTESGAPVYGFYITTERENPGLKRQEDVS